MEFKDHECALPSQFRKEHIVNEWIDTGMFISARRIIKKLTMVDGKHPYCQLFYKSTAVKRKEHERHMLTHPLMIHPFSIFTLYWEFFIAIIYLLLFITVPIHIAVTINIPFSPTWYIVPVLNVFHSIDIGVIFFSGYFNYTQGKTILTPWYVALRYFKTYFIFDVLSVIPSVIILVDLTASHEQHHGSLHYLRYLHLLKITRCISFFETCEVMKLYFRIPSYLYMGLKIILTYILFWIWCCAVMYCITNWDKVTVPKTLEEVLDDFYGSTLIFLVVNYGNNVILSMTEVVCSIIFLYIGFTFHLYLISKMLQMWEKYTSITNKHDTLYKELNEYMKYKVLPAALRKRIIYYLDFKYQKQFYNERKVSNIFSTKLQDEITESIYKGYLEKLEIFQDIPADIQLKILSTLQTEIYLPNDVILRSGQEGNCMYIVLTGTVAIYATTGREICHLEDGAHFGEIALVVSHRRIASVVAVTACELFILKRGDFLRILEPYPSVRDNVLQTAAQRYVETSKINLSQ